MIKAEYIYLSSHGHWSEPITGSSQQALRASTIALSNYSPDRPGSVLTAEDIARLDLTHSQLVVLSACDSGRGWTVNGQGSLGFQTAFMAAGVHTLLVALWPIPTDATEAFMHSFYTHYIAHHGSAEKAFRAAQDEVRRQPQFADPSNWAAWVLVGGE
jgi:CHAT domain-containing protein